MPSSIAPVPHSDELQIFSAAEHSSYEGERQRTSNSNESFPNEDTEKGQYILNQEKLDDLIRELQLAKSKAECIDSRQKEWGLLLPSCKISKCRNRHEEFSPFF